MAGTARKTLAPTAGPPLVGHLDWSASNLRLAGSAVGVVYDWDSLRLEPEPVVVVAAAIHFTYTEHLDVPNASHPSGSTVLPCPLRAGPGGGVQRRGPYGGRRRRYLQPTYTAPCEHALDPDGTGVEDGARALLLAHGDQFLAS